MFAYTVKGEAAELEKLSVDPYNSKVEEVMNENGLTSVMLLDEEGRKIGEVTTS